jgi:soluble lytic murein transglycosylase-like protein
MKLRALWISVLLLWIRASPLYAPNVLHPAYHPATFTWSQRYRIQPRLAELILVAADRHHIPYSIAMRLVRRESTFRPKARGRAGEIGLTQVLPSTAEDMMPGVTQEQLFNPHINVEVGFRYLEWIRQRYPTDWRKTLTAYNQGLTTVRKGLTTSPYSKDILRGDYGNQMATGQH